MKRLLLNLTAGISLLLCFAAIVLWGRSYRTLPSLSEADSINFTRDDPRYWIISYPGRAVLCRQVGKDWDKPLKEFHFLGINYGGGWGAGSILWNLSVPYWMIVLLILIVPAIRLECWRRERVEARRLTRGLCPQCGYDLRATPDRCPECGHVARASCP